MSIEERWRQARAQHWVLAQQAGLRRAQKRLFRRWMSDALNAQEYRLTQALWNLLGHVPREH
jgi:hypothetical protein